MYVIAGQDHVIDKRDIIGIFDIDKLTVFKTNREYLSKLEKRGKIISGAEKLPKSFIVCCVDGQEDVYISPFLPSTLTKR